MEYLGNIPSTLEGSTILIPSISTGWIAQAVLDLIIKTYQIPRIGIFEDEAILPVVCSLRSTPSVATALELFHKPELNLSIIQHRSAPATVYPILFPLVYRFKGHSLVVAHRLMSWVRSHKFGKVFIISTANVAFRIPQQVATNELTFALTLIPIYCIPSCL